MTLPENPTGRDLAAFADELRSLVAIVRNLPATNSSNGLQTALYTALWADLVADEHFGREARAAIKAEEEAAASAQAAEGAAVGEPVKVRKVRFNRPQQRYVFIQGEFDEGVALPVNKHGKLTISFDS
jgi:hypothetical protein